MQIPNTHAHTFIQLPMHLHIPIHKSTNTYACAHTYIQILIHMQQHTYIQTPMHIHRLIHVYKHLYITRLRLSSVCCAAPLSSWELETDSNGLAEARGLRVSKAGQHVLRFVAVLWGDTRVEAVSAPFEVVAGPTVSAAFSLRPPRRVLVREPFSVVVSLLDSEGNESPVPPEGQQEEELTKVRVEAVDAEGREVLLGGQTERLWGGGQVAFEGLWLQRQGPVSLKVSLTVQSPLRRMQGLATKYCKKPQTQSLCLFVAVLLLRPPAPHARSTRPSLLPLYWSRRSRRCAYTRRRCCWSPEAREMKQQTRCRQPSTGGSCTSLWRRRTGASGPPNGPSL